MKDPNFNKVVSMIGSQSEAMFDPEDLLKDIEDKLDEKLDEISPLSGKQYISNIENSLIRERIAKE